MLHGMATHIRQMVLKMAFVNKDDMVCHNINRYGKEKTRECTEVFEVKANGTQGRIHIGDVVLPSSFIGTKVKFKMEIIHGGK